MLDEIVGENMRTDVRIGHILTPLELPRTRRTGSIGGVFRRKSHFTKEL
jgi:hypothetical protein